MVEWKGVYWSPPARAPKLQLFWILEQPSTGGCWNPSKKDTLRPEKKPQWDSRRSAIAIKSNPIPTEWASHKLENSNTEEILRLLWRFWAPWQAFQLGDLTKNGDPQGIWPSGQQNLIIGLPQDWGKQRLYSLRARSFACTKTQGKGGVTSQETEPDLPASVRQSPVEAWVSKGLPQG